MEETMEASPSDKIVQLLNELEELTFSEQLLTQQKCETCRKCDNCDIFPDMGKFEFYFHQSIKA